MSDLKHLKIVSKGFAAYTGPLHVHLFKDGMSVEPISKVDRDRISASMRCIEVSASGKEQIAGVAERLISASAKRAPVIKALKRQDPKDKVAEEVKLATGAVNPKRLYTEEQLDEAIEAGGIQGLREIANIWNVKNRSIPALRQMILDEQKEWEGKAGKAEADLLRRVSKVAEKVSKENGITEEPKVEAPEAKHEAAKTGDMSSAISKTE